MHTNIPPELEDKFMSCKEKVMSGGQDEESAHGICYAAVVEGKADAASLAGKYGFLLDSDTVKTAAKFMSAPVKAMGDWELDVLALPFDKVDSDHQHFDSRTDIMPEIFGNPAIIYHHGVMPGKGAIEQKPVIIGKAVSVTKQADGWHVRVMLDKTIEYARRVWEAAKRGMAVASSDSISHLARLDIGGGKNIMYEKDRPGRIAVWPLAGLSLWDLTEGNFRPASRYAIALPAMKAIYREAGIPFPVMAGNTDGVLLADNTAAKRARTSNVKQEIEDFLSKLDHK